MSGLCYGRFCGNMKIAGRWRLRAYPQLKSKSHKEL